MSYWDMQRLRMKSGGNTLRESRVISARRSIIDGFYDNISYSLVDAYYPSTPFSSSPLDTWITDKSDIKDQKNIVIYPGQYFTNGSIVFWKNQYWLSVHTDPDLGDVYTRGVLSLCYGSLKWLDSQGVIREAWFARKTDVSPNFGIDERSKFIVMPDERRQIIVQSNAFTQEFKKSHRFIVDGRCWRIITLDDVTDGVINIVLEEDLINPATDRVDLRIANYYENTYSVRILNGDSASLDLNQSMQLNVEAYKNNIRVDSDEITLSTDNPEVGTIDQNKVFTPLSIGAVNVSATYESATDSIQITVRSIQYNNYTVEISGESSVYLNKSSLYSPVFMNNGFVIDEPAEFYLTADDEVTPTTLASISSQTNNACTILAGNKQGYVRLHAKSRNGLISGNKRILIKSYF